MPEEPSVQSVGHETSSSSLQRRTLLQLALAATTGVAVSRPASAVPPTDGHPAALKLLLDRATNYLSASTIANDIRYQHIWNAPGNPRELWFNDLNLVDTGNTGAISGTVTAAAISHPGVAVPPNLDNAVRYANTVQAARVFKDQIPIARRRIQNLLTAVEREASWYAFQIGFRLGYQKAKEPGSQTYANVVDVPVTGMTDTVICGIHAVIHDPSAHNLTVAPDGLFTPGCGPISGHASY